MEVKTDIALASMDLSVSTSVLGCFARFSPGQLFARDR